VIVEERVPGVCHGTGGASGRAGHRPMNADNVHYVK
jgi:hypothetical protein